MGRQIVTFADAARGGGERSSPIGGSLPVDGYLDRLVKYLPAEAAAIYTTGVKLFESQEVLSLLSQAIFAGVVFLLTPLYLYRVLKVSKPLQIILSLLSLVIWMSILGGPVVDFLGASWRLFDVAVALAIPVATFVFPIFKP